MDKEWVAWLGGFVDGEGTVGLSQTNNKTQAHPYLRPHFQIVNTNRALLEKAADVIQSITQKRPTIVIANKGGNGWKVGYRLAVHTQWELQLLIPAVMPFLVGKSEQAQLVLEFCRRRNGRLNYKWYEFANEDELAYKKCLLLNRRGTTVETGGGFSILSRVDEGTVRTVEESTEMAEMAIRQLQLVSK